MSKEDAIIHDAVHLYFDIHQILATWAEEDDICQAVADLCADDTCVATLLRTVELVMQEDWLTVRLQHEADLTFAPYSCVFVR